MSGTCGIITRILLGIINVIFLLVGIALVVTSCLLKWGNLGNLGNYKAVATATSIIAIDGVSIALICIGGFTIFVSLLGLFGLACSNRCLLVFYEIVVVIVFIVHLAALIVLLVAYGPVQTAFTQAFNSTIQTLNSPTTRNQTTCNLMYNVSSIFNCCGAASSSDLNSNAADLCCIKPTPQQGCSTLIFNEIKKYSIYLLIIPTAILLGIELLCIALVPCLIASISRNKL